MATRIDTIRARLEAATEFGMDAREDPTFRAHAPEDIVYLLSRVEELEKDAGLNGLCLNAMHAADDIQVARIAALEEEASRLRKAIDRFVDRHGYETYWQAVLDECLSGSGEGG